ncbi:MAG: CHAT domain-containing protein, partial [Acidimicrobiia bacterium]
MTVIDQSTVRYGDLQIGLHRRGEALMIEASYLPPDADGEVRLDSAEPVTLPDLATLDGQDSVAYGRALSTALFASSPVRELFAKARGNAEGAGEALRLRLFIGPSAPDLHVLHWETLSDPEDGSPLATSESVLFSRFLNSADMRPAGGRSKDTLRAVVAVASPTDIAQYAPGGQPLPPVDAAAEFARARAALGDATIVEVGGEKRATLAAIIAALRQGCDVLYLVAHGFVVEGQPQLLLENDAGLAERLPAEKLVERFGDMQTLPQLVVLASCQSAGGNAPVTGGALARVGPRLAEVGVPAVIAMQHDVSMTTVDSFMPELFRALDEHGFIDRAVASARGVVRDRPDWWVPLLFTRLRSGRLWYSPGFVHTEDFEQWPTLISAIEGGRCTPILGPGVTDVFLGTRHDIARRWAQTYRFPMANDRDDLAQVAQYVAVNYDDTFLQAELGKYLVNELAERYGEMLAGDASNAGESGQATLDELLTRVWSLRREKGLSDPFTVLAGLPFSMYVTTNPASLLTDALTAAQKEPRVEMCPWSNEVDWPPSVFEDEPNYEPTAPQPLVYYLFGRLGMPDTLVLRQDDYFDFLIGVTQNNALIPECVRKQWVASALLFVGFNLDEWDSRVVFRTVMNREARGRRKKFTHIAVQIDPEEGRTIAPDQARRYLQKYFEGADVSIYWGSTDD